MNRFHDADFRAQQSFPPQPSACPHASPTLLLAVSLCFTMLYFISFCSNTQLGKDINTKKVDNKEILYRERL